MNTNIKILILSDIHFGHNRTKTEFIIDNLYKFFNTYNKIINQLDMIIISGDVFDRLLPNNSRDYSLAIEWLSNLSRFCQKNTIKLRILEGTPSHDFKQLKTFSTILERLDIDIDFKYFDTVSIEHIDEYSTDILYIPDEANETAKETYEEVNELLKSKQLSKVDLIIMHGQFHYHLPMFHSEVSHTEEDYLSIVNSFIICGHIHTHSTYKDILTPGSFERLSHNEEEKKGGLYLHIGPNTKEYLFLENKYSKIYKTLYYDLETLDIIINDIIKLRLPDDSNIRIRIKKDSNLKDSLHLLKDKFKHLNIKIEYTDKSEEEHKRIEIITNSEELHITKENIISLIMKEVYDIDEEHKNILHKELSDIVNN